MRIVPTLLAAAWLAAAPALAQDADPAPAATARPHGAQKKAPPKKSTMSEEKRRDLERRIETLERKHEMGYRETPGAPADAPVAPGLVDDE
jgi:hypothetical protein